MKIVKNMISLMSFKKLSLFILILLMRIMPLSALRKPIIENGRYYYSIDDTHQHIDLTRAFQFLRRKIISPFSWKGFLKKLMYSAQKNQFSIIPIQTVPTKNSQEPIITWIGHSSFLIQIDGLNIVTDPIFGSVKVGPFPIMKRRMAPGVLLKDLPPIDVILISHNHNDHTDRDTLIEIQKKYNPAVLIPNGNEKLFKNFGFNHISEQNWGDTFQISKNGKSICFTFLPAYHWSIRFSLDSYRKSLWGSWMIKGNDTTIYFAGDTAYGDHFNEIAELYPTIDIVLMPIGPANIDHSKYRYSHINPMQAVDAFCQLNAKVFIPMHYGTFDTTQEGYNLSLTLLQDTWQAHEKELADKKLIIAQCGRRYKFIKKRDESKN